MRKTGFYFLLASFTKLWLSLYLTNFYMIKKLEVYGSIGENGFAAIPTLVLWIIGLEFIIGIVLIISGEKLFGSDKKKTMDT